ncbi:unnamed protein product [Peronospora belbahrii]|uniref:Uncharacterized protein n=1 Tax=Peronospora belbahrii TaxID=622444 RepID=A0AAU9L179_9STRA|nr:unnamed protein product [Peronospora belbahrii]
MSVAYEKVASLQFTAYLFSQVTDVELAWLWRCLLIIAQPDVDIKYHNNLVNIFFQFIRYDLSGCLVCKLCIVYKGESSHNRKQEQIQNLLATLCYRSFNRRKFKRTADIKHIEFQYNVNLDPNATVPWATIHTEDHAGNHQWAQGEKRNVGCWFSLMHHYKVETPVSGWNLHPQTHRPYKYLNTCNHMMGEKDNNPNLSKFNWIEYPFQPGGDEDAFKYVVDHVPTKCNFCSCLCFCRARNGGGWCDRHPGGNTVSRDGKSIYLKHPSTNSLTSSQLLSMGICFFVLPSLDVLGTRKR